MHLSSPIWTALNSTVWIDRVCLNTPFGPGAAIKAQSGHSQEREVVVEDGGRQKSWSPFQFQNSTPALTHARKNLEHMALCASARQVQVAAATLFEDSMEKSVLVT